MQFMGDTKFFDGVDEALGRMCGACSTDNEIDHISDTQVNFKIAKSPTTG